jgi:L-lactate dehydrogenase complex protein LldG
MPARENILARIRSANASQASRRASPDSVLKRLRERPRGPGPKMDWEPIARFKSRSIAAASTVDEVGGYADIPAAVARYLGEHELPKDAVCWEEFAGLDWGGTGVNVSVRPAQGEDKVGITGTYCAVAETGTLMLLSGEHQHATTSLLPETHVAILTASRIVPAMEDAWGLLREEVGELPRQVNFVSGPSRTADIEMTLVYGAHGPFRVHVIIVGE